MNATKRILNHISIKHDVLVPSDEDAIRKVGNHINNNEYSILHVLYGQKFLLALIDYYEQEEQYEKCASVVKYIDGFNREFPFEKAIPKKIVNL